MALRLVRRGEARSVAQTLQGRDFSGLRFGNQTPTDIDCAIGVNDASLILIEAKHKNDSRLSDGQRRFLETMVDACRLPALAIHGVHATPMHLPIDFAELRVLRYYRPARGWTWFSRHVPARVVVGQFLRRFGGL